MLYTARAGILSSTTLATVIAFAGVSAANAEDGAQLHRLVIGKLPSDGLTSASSGRSWRLATFNKTTQIDAAYLYGHNVIVFGWVGSNIGLITVIDAATGKEKLEFLSLGSRITPKGLIVFERFYPHFSDPSIVSDAIAELDLKQAIPHNVPAQPNENPTDQVGTTIYPRGPTPGVRHEIGDNYAVTDAGTVLFLVDRLSTGKLCLVRLSVSRLDDDQAPKENCMTSESFGVSDLAGVHIRRFSENTFGDLILSTDLGGPKSATQKDFEVDKSSLSIAALNGSPEKAGEKPFSVPWPVLRTGLASFVPLDVTTKSVAAFAQETMKARLLIDTRGVVREAAVSGLPDPPSQLIRDVILQWRFDPTILDGRNVEVETEFSSQVGKLTKIPD